MFKTKREMYQSLRGQLDMERSSFIPQWRDLGDYVLPMRPRFTVSEVNKGQRKNQKIIDSTATLALRTLRSGMMSGITSPARPWFKLTTPDPGLAESSSVKAWLHYVSQRMLAVFTKSNIYNTLPITYGDLGLFGTAAMFVDEDQEEVLRGYSFPIGSYMIAKDHRGRVNVFMREFRMTIRQLVDKFGDKVNGKPDWSKFSVHVRNQYEQANYEAWVDVTHVIAPNVEYDPKKLHSKYKRFASCYYESGTSMAAPKGNHMAAEKDIYLSEKGFDYFPVLCPRWEVSGEDVYGTDCPGMTALGDVKALQTMHKRKAQAIEKMVNPPMKGPSSLKSVKASILPGDITYSDEREGSKGFTPIYQIEPRIQELVGDIQDTRQTIQRAFYEDLFLMLATLDRRQITAREIDERHEEKLLALGPVLEQLNQDLLDPMIDNTFNFMMNQGLIPPPPEELQGIELKVEYISIMSQAQKLVGLSGIERFAGFVNNVAQVMPSIVDKVDCDKLAEIYGDLTSVPPGIVRSPDDVNAIRGQRAQQQQSQQMVEQIQGGAGALKNLSETSMSTDNALTRLISQAKAGQLVAAQ